MHKMQRGFASAGSLFAGIAVIVLVVAVAFAVFGSSESPQTSSLETSQEGLGGASGPVLESVHYFKKGVSLGTDEYIHFSVGGTIQTGSNQASWLNTTGRTVYIDLAEVIPSNNASSSMNVSAGTTSAATISNNYTEPANAKLIDNYLLATSTGLSTVINSMKDAGTDGRMVVPVRAGEYVNIIFRQHNAGTCTGAVCEAATSTARGFTSVIWRLEGHYKQ